MQNVFITDAKRYVPIVTLNTEDNTKLSKLLSKGFKRPIYWNEYKVIPAKIYAANENIRILILADKELTDYLFLLI